MKCLVVITHPLQKSLCGYLAEKTVNKLADNKHDIDVLDLYEQNFSPALTETERESYYRAYDSSAVDEHAKRLQEAEAIVLLFPTWWFGFPAMLKGWFDRVWGPGIAYDHASNFGPITPRLSNLKQVLVVTTLGSPWWVDRLVMRQPVKRTLKAALLGACAKKCNLDFLSLYNCEELNDNDIKIFTNKIIKTLDKWR